MAFRLSFLLNQLRNENANNGDSSENSELKEGNEQIKTKSESEIPSDVVDVLNHLILSVSDSTVNDDRRIEESGIIMMLEKSAPKLERAFENNNVTDDNINNTNVIEDVDVVNTDNTFLQKFDFSQIPCQITGAWNEFIGGIKNNYTRGCKWAPDGSCILTCSDDNNLRIFNMPEELWDTDRWQDMSEMRSVLKISEGEIIYDYCWYPLMNSADPCTCCLISCSKNSTVHLWDGFTGELRCSYRAYDQMDEITTPHSLSFDVDGNRIFCGFEKIIRIFDLNLPGRKCMERKTFDKKSGQPGIISCFAFTPANRSVSVAGSYQRTIGIYSEPDGLLEYVVEGQRGGITQLQFSPDGNLLYSGGRKDSDILCWDMRKLGEILYTMRRCCLTNQRMYFDITRDGQFIISGNTNGVISIWDTSKEPKDVGLDDYNILEPVQFFLAHNDCVNGISIHPSYPLLCSSSGQRKFPDLLSDDDEGIFSPKTEQTDNSLRLWWIGERS